MTEETGAVSLQSISAVDRLIHEPARLMIVTILYASAGADFLYLLHETGLTKGNLSAHLGKLEEAGYVKIEKIFRGKIPQTLLSLTPEGRSAFENYREQLKQIVQSISKE
jgi:DNA-binding MarR family transcriptional regulator